VSVYLDASVLVAVFIEDAFTSRARSFLGTQLPAVVVSDFAAAEFASAVSRLVRTDELTPDQGHAVLADFKMWRASGSDAVLVASADIAAATGFLSRLDLTLRTADAINIAIAQRLGAVLATFDMKMAASARAFGVVLADA
jgi:predicted nucleic acid-binding protein